ncbi:MAG: SulP family inorganic anion transporter, partial [Pseudomonadota bacterium]|nr:SulP family inorganic anion transporter [Pseudomonadota bacterium]
VAPLAVGVGLTALIVSLVVRRWRPNWPAMLIGLTTATLLAYVAREAGLGPVPVIGPLAPIHLRFAVPDVELQRLGDLVGIAFALTIVALGQSIAIAKAVAARSGQHLDANREFRGQGLSNIVGGFFSAYVSCGSFNRSMPNLHAGARTPLAAVAAALWLLGLVSVIAPLLAYIPMPAISGLLLLIGWTLFDAAGWQRMWRGSRVDFAVAAATFVATLTIRIEMAILLGTLLSLFVYLQRTSKPALRVMGFDSADAARPFVVRAEVPSPLPECPQLKMIRMEGEVYFAAVSHVGDELRDLRAPVDAPKHLLVMAKSMNFIDVAGAELWQGELRARRAAGGDLYFHRPRSSVLVLWRRLGFMGELGVDHIFPAKRIAIASIFGRLDPSICARCTVRVFDECKTLPEPVPPLIGAAVPSTP